VVLVKKFIRPHPNPSPGDSTSPPKSPSPGGEGDLKSAKFEPLSRRERGKRA